MADDVQRLCEVICRLQFVQIELINVKVDIEFSDKTVLSEGANEDFDVFLNAFEIKAVNFVV